MATREELQLLIRTIAENAGTDQSKAALAGLRAETQASELANRRLAASVRATEIANREAAAASRAAATATRSSAVAAQQASQSQTGIAGAFGLTNASMLRMTGALIGVSGGLAAVTIAAHLATQAIGGVLDTSIKFGGQMAGVAAVSGATAAQLERLSEAARVGGKDIGVGAVEGAKGLQELIKGGVSARDALGGALQATELLSRAGGVELAQAAEISATALNSFGLSAAQLAHVADMVAGAANASSIGVDDFRLSLSQAGAVARTIGVTFDDTAVAIAELGQAGIKGSDAGTSLRTFLLSLTPTTKEATAELQKLGIVTASGSNKFFDASGKAKSLADISQILKTSLAGYTDQQRLATLQTIFGTDALRAASIFAREGASGFDRLSLAISKINASDVAKTRLNSLEGDLRKLQVQADATAISLAKVANQPLRGGAQFATGALEAADKILETLAQIPKLAGSIPIGPAKIPAMLLQLQALSQVPALQAAKLKTLDAEFQAEMAEDQAAALSYIRAWQAAGTATDQFGFKLGTVTDWFRRLHPSIAEVVADIGTLQSRSTELQAIFDALAPDDTATRGLAQGLIDQEQASSRLTASRKAALFVEQELQRMRVLANFDVTSPEGSAVRDQLREIQTAAERLAAVKEPAWINSMDAGLSRAHSSFERINQDLATIQSRSSALAGVLGALFPNDTAARAAVMTLQDMDRAEARITATLAVRARFEEEIRQLRESTKITDPRDAGGASAAQKRLDLLNELAPMERQLLDLQDQQNDLRRESTRLEQEHEQAVLRARQAALPAAQAQEDATFEQQRLKLKIQADALAGRGVSGADVARLTHLALNQPAVDLAALNAGRPVTLAQRGQGNAAIATGLAGNPLQQKIDALQKQVDDLLARALTASKTPGTLTINISGTLNPTEIADAVVDVLETVQRQGTQPVPAFTPGSRGTSVMPGRVPRTS